MLKYLLIFCLVFVSVVAQSNCRDFSSLSQEELWYIFCYIRQAVIPNVFQNYFMITLGSISILGLIFTLATWKMYPSFSVPSDIMFAICMSQLIENSTLVATTIYFLINKSSPTPPSDFQSACTSISVINSFGNISSTLYNVVFCAILSLSIRKPLKGIFINQSRYHTIVMATVATLTLALTLSQTLGPQSSGICGYKLQDRESFARFTLEIVIVGVCLFSMYKFKARIPKSSYFKKAASFGFYYYYMGFFSIIQIISTLSYLVGSISCKSGAENTSTIIAVSITFGSCSSITLSFVLIALRFSHPLVRMHIKKLCQKDNFIKMEDECLTDNKSDYVWLGQLVESIKGSQIVSFLSALLIIYSETEHRVKKQEDISQYSFKKKYVLRLNEDNVEEFMLKKSANRDSYIIRQKLGGIKVLEYQITVYAVEIFTQLAANLAIFESFNIKQNIPLVTEKAYSDGGKSGQFMFGTFNNKFIIKTITEDEAVLYLDKLKEFYEYFRKNPETMITKILGLFKFDRVDINEEPIFIILMENVSPYDRKFQERVYDIKGSEFNRSTIEEKSIANEQKLRHHTLKDIDFKKLEQRICIQPESADRLKNQLKKDAQFLGRAGVMDYSVLIIKRKGKLIERQQIFKPQLHNQFRSYAALDEYYNIGIIDYLQSWTLRRKAERAFKTMITNKKVTVTSPGEYSTRLSNFIDEII